MSTVAPPAVNGFAFRLPHLADDVRSALLCSPPDYCFPLTAAFMSNSVPQSIIDLMAEANTCVGRDGSLDDFKHLRVITAFASRLDAPIKDRVVETVIRVGCAAFAAKKKCPINTARAELFSACSEGETSTTRIALLPPLLRTFAPTQLSELVRKIQLSHEDWSLLHCNQVALDRVLAEGAFPSLVADAFRCKPSTWKPHCSFELFKKTLSNLGPMMVMGSLGSNCNPSPPVPHPISILDMPTFHWSKSANKTAEPQVPPQKIHAVLVIGAAIVEGTPMVYFVDVNHVDPVQVFAVSYRGLQKKAFGSPCMTVSDQLGDDLRKYIQDSQIFGYHSPDWKTPASQL